MTPGLAFSRARERGSGGEGILPFDPFAADRLREFAEAIEPRLAPDGDLDPIVDWASKLVGAVARIAGLLHLASLDLPLPDDPLPLSRVRERAVGMRGPMVGVMEGAGGWGLFAPGAPTTSPEHS